MLIGLSGLAGSGKSEVARVLIEEFGFERVKFADPLKNMLRRMLADAGHCEDDVERMIEGDLKEVVIPDLGVTPRHLMITLGTEWGRDQVRPDLWTKLWGMRADVFENVVADDVRFPNEVETIRARGGFLIRVHRDGLARGTHSSEALDVEPDCTIYNTGTLEELRGMVRVAVHKAKLAALKCPVPPPGWACTREPGHEGPCAAVPACA